MDIFDEELWSPEPQEEGAVVLCAASAYEKKYYLNPAFSRLPEGVQEELEILCVLYTSDVGGILTLQFDDSGNLLFHVTAKEEDFFFDEIGSVLKIKQIQNEKRELLESLELYYRAFFLKEDVGELLDETRE